MRTLEKLIVYALVRHLDAAGYVPDHVDDYDRELSRDETRVTDAASIIKFIEEVDMLPYRVRFVAKALGPAAGYTWLSLIEGNGEDILSDWGIARGVHERWNEALGSFDVDEALMALVAPLGVTATVTAPTYSLAEVRNGTGWAPGQRFALVGGAR